MSTNGDQRRAWMALSLYNNALTEAEKSARVPEDFQNWLWGHIQRWPSEFAWEDWSTYRPSIRKVYLIPEEQS